MENKNTTQNPEEEMVKDKKEYNEVENQPTIEGEVSANMADEAQNEDDATEKLTAEVAMWCEKYVRLQAEFDNYRKRTLKEKMDLISSGGEDVIKSLLPVLDDLDRALEAMRTATDVEAVREGVELISQKMRQTLNSKGMTEIEAVGKELNTDYHEAVAKIPVDKKHRGKIIDVVQKGYELNEKVIRHSKVVIGE